MTARRGMRWLPWALVGLAPLLVAGTTIISIQAADLDHHPLGVGDWLSQVLVSLPPLTFTLMGAFVLARRPGNRIGWLMILVGLGYGFGGFTSNFSNPTSSSLPLRDLMVWMQGWDFTLYLIGLMLLVLLFPTGELPSPRWRWVMWVGLVCWTAVSLLAAVGQVPGDATTPQNPYGFVPVPVALIVILAACGLLAVGAALVSVALRFRSARGVERQQLKWFAYGAALAVIWVLAAFVTGWSVGLVVFLAVGSLAALPIFMGVAILRFRLYEIDVLINRTLVYGPLSISLAALYLSAILSMQTLFSHGTHQTSDLAIAISTLAVAALFQPLRRRTQRFIDHRFYRRKYNAVQTLGAFQSRVPSVVDLDDLTGDLLGVVQDTVQPSHMALWLRHEQSL